MKESEDGLLLFLLAKVNCQPGDITGLLHFCFPFISFFLTSGEQPKFSLHGGESEVHRVMELEILLSVQSPQTLRNIPRSPLKRVC